MAICSVCGMADDERDHSDCIDYERARSNGAWWECFTCTCCHQFYKDYLAWRWFKYLGHEGD